MKIYHLTPGEKILAMIQQSGKRWHVRIITASPGGSRVQHRECMVNAPEQLSALTVAIATEWEDLPVGEFDDVHILVDPMPPKPLSEEDIIARAERREPH